MQSSEGGPTDRSGCVLMDEQRRLDTFLLAIHELGHEKKFKGRGGAKQVSDRSSVGPRLYI